MKGMSVLQSDIKINFFDHDYLGYSGFERILVFSRGSPARFGVNFGDVIGTYRDAAVNCEFNYAEMLRVYEFIESALGENWVNIILKSKIYELQDIALFFHYVERYLSDGVKIFDVYECFNFDLDWIYRFGAIKYVTLEYSKFWRGLFCYYDSDFLKISEGVASDYILKNVIFEKLEARKMSGSDAEAFVERASDWAPRLLKRNGYVFS